MGAYTPLGFKSKAISGLQSRNWTGVEGRELGFREEAREGEFWPWDLRMSLYCPGDRPSGDTSFLLPMKKV